MQSWRQLMQRRLWQEEFVAVAAVGLGHLQRHWANKEEPIPASSSTMNPWELRAIDALLSQCLLQRLPHLVDHRLHLRAQLHFPLLRAQEHLAHLHRRRLAGKRLKAAGIRFCSLQRCAQPLHLLVHISALHLRRYLCGLERCHLSEQLHHCQFHLLEPVGGRTANGHRPCEGACTFRRKHCQRNGCAARCERRKCGRRGFHALARYRLVLQHRLQRADQCGKRRALTRYLSIHALRILHPARLDQLPHVGPSTRLPLFATLEQRPLARHDIGHHLDVAHACPWHLAHGQLPHDQCKRVDVRRRGDECTALPSQPEELGCLVAGRAALGDRGECRDRADGLRGRQPKVGHPRLTVGQQHVLRLEVEVQDGVGVDGGHAARDAAEQRHRGLC
mmetsp:Transcript_65190/g.128985  ORF Transcript_65190/g.128985 Transcript_65190/m.128985 type:complete len:391 (-) Transcript_65190:1517-2689(-)